MLWLVCYDISDDRRRDRCAMWLLRYASRVQESVFEAQCPKPGQFERLWQGLAERIADQDLVRAYPIGVQAMQAVRVLGPGEGPKPLPYATVF